MDVGIIGHGYAHHLSTKHFGAVNQFGGNYLFAQNMLIVIYVLAEQVESNDSLLKSAFNRSRFGRRNNAGNQVKGKNAFHARGIIVDSEGNSLIPEGDVRHLPPAQECTVIQTGKLSINRFVMLPGNT